ncbi:hypothetical protein FOYG_13249 [Fusarium oxysporum NRRL 32931]|uniref:Uncharacterized protein n=1 Tax=Fusarium oxysporum NRRL 32931 TaxID=660029 RepID=W9HRJ6_FUSOX|nr:hypothetical protein FOYG_13249 [Fusarium oxysporum NRRL 32931]
MNMTCTPPATPKRQRNNAASDNVAQNVLCGIEEKSREIRFHGHIVKRLATKLQARARRALQAGSSIDELFAAALEKKKAEEAEPSDVKAEPSSN